MINANKITYFETPVNSKITDSLLNREAAVVFLITILLLPPRKNLGKQPPPPTPTEFAFWTPPPSPLNFHCPKWGGGVWIFSGTTTLLYYLLYYKFIFLFTGIYLFNENVDKRLKMEYYSFALLASCKNRNPKEGVSKFHTRSMSQRFHRLVYF